MNNFRNQAKPQYIQYTLFSYPIIALPNEYQKIIDDKQAWFNIFFEEVVQRIDEHIFDVLFDMSRGAAAFPVKILVALMIYKEGMNLSVEQVLMEAIFRLDLRIALGLKDFNGGVPCKATYYNFRKAVEIYYIMSGINLFHECFKNITQQYIECYGIDCEELRMDSKLVNSDIDMNLSRVGLVHKTILYDMAKNKGLIKKGYLSKELVSEIEGIKNFDSEKYVYGHSAAEQKDTLTALGEICLRIVKELDAQGFNEKAFSLVRRVLVEQFDVVDGKVVAKNGKDIKPSSLQSPYDSDAAFRRKNGIDYKGYSVNITETIGEDNELNFIVNVQVEAATYADNDFVIPSLVEIKGYTNQLMSKVRADGAYWSVGNEQRCALMNMARPPMSLEEMKLLGCECNNAKTLILKHLVDGKPLTIRSFIPEENGVKLITSNMPGKKSKFDLTREGDKLTIENTETGDIFQVDGVTKKCKDGTEEMTWSIKYYDEDKKKNVYKTFTEQNVRTCEKRREIENMPTEERNKRNNVEATVFQMSFTLRKDSSRYRGKSAHVGMFNLRAIWVNFRRIAVWKNAKTTKSLFALPAA